MAQMNISNLQKKNGEMKISILSHAELKTLFIRMVKELSKDLKSIKRST